VSDRVISPKNQDADAAFDASLRPKRLEDYIGQDKVKERLRIFVDAAKARNESIDHLLLYGPPGLGKTTLAGIVAQEMGSQLKITSGPAIAIPGDLASILTSLQKGDIVFIDEIHRLSRTVEEALYPAMEDFSWDMILGKGMGAKSIRLHLPHFTVIGATTRYALLSSPLRDRFGETYRLDYYTPKALEDIVRRSARILGVEIDDAGAREISGRCRGTPRIANRLLKRVRDFAQIRADGRITLAVAKEALAMLEVDPLGLDEIDRRLLTAVMDKYDGGPVGLETLAAAISEEADTVMDVYEPFLLQLGFIVRTPRGRMVTRLAYEHLGRPVPRRVEPTDQPELF
jgi:Holliday junction DNA helicase RuvB